MAISPFKSGQWSWDDVNNTLYFTSKEPYLLVPSQLAINLPLNTPKATKSQKPQPSHEIKFREIVDNLEQIKFRRHYQRRCKPTEPKVITIQDIKDIAIFIANTRDLSKDFIRYFHLPTMDRFLRSLIVYFQYYIQIWENMLESRKVAASKLYHPRALKLENKVRDNLSDLRAMVAREYCCILTGIEDALRFHHMNNNNHNSLSDKDKRLFETLVCMAVRVVWIALYRKHLSLIELEMSRLLRTDIFNLIVHRGLRGGEDLQRSANEHRVLAGLSNTDERKLLHRSPLAKEIIIGTHDHRLLIAGFRDYKPKDDILQYLEVAYCAPEEKLIELGVTVGMLGIPREEYDAMLLNMERSPRKRRASYVPRVMPDFKLPEIAVDSDAEIERTISTNPPLYSPTKQSIKARKTQCAIWTKLIMKVDEGRDISAVDLSTRSSHSVLTK